MSPAVRAFGSSALRSVVTAVERSRRPSEAAAKAMLPLVGTAQTNVRSTLTKVAISDPPGRSAASACSTVAGGGLMSWA